MTAIAGACESVTIDGRRFAVTADNGAERDLGGFTAEVLPNSDGTAVKKLTRRPWMLSGLTVEIDDTRQDQEFLQDKANEGGFYPCSAKFANGVSYAGEGTVSAEIKFKSDTSTADIELSGPQEMKQV